MSNRRRQRTKKSNKLIRGRSKTRVGVVVLVVCLVGVSSVAAPWVRNLATKTAPTFLASALPLPSPDHPSKEYIYAGGKLIATEEPTVTLLAPANLSALTVSNLPTPKVSVNWSAVENAHHYEVERASDSNGPFTVVASNVTQTSLEDTGVSAVTAYLYRVRAFSTGGPPSPYSNLDLATAIAFTDDTLESQSTLFKAAHINELRQAVNAIRSMAHLSAINWGGNVTQFSTEIQATHIQALREALSDALTALNLPPCSYTDNSLTALRASLFKKEHIEQLRQCVR
jgi:hypothetical protein